MSTMFGDDVLILIFLRLPAKSLVRFKLVSTQWRRIISDPHFIRSHVDFKRLAGSGSWTGSQSAVCLLRPLSYIESRNPLIIIPMNEDDAPISHRRYLMGMCDGLICFREVRIRTQLHQVRHHSYPVPQHMVHFSISNPLLRQRFIVNNRVGQFSRLFCQYPLKHNVPLAYGFCHDKEMEDYCVTLMYYFTCDRLSVEIYWFRQHRFIRFAVQSPEERVDISGTKFSYMSFYHITGNHGVGFNLSRLNLQTRMFETISLPNATQYYGLSLMDGLLITVTRVEGVEGEQGKFHIWMLKDPAQWTLMATIKDCSRILREARFLAPVCLCKDMLLVSVIFPENQWLFQVCLTSGNTSRVGGTYHILAGYLESLMDPQVCQAQVQPAHN